MDIYLLQISNRNSEKKVRNPIKGNSKRPDQRYDVILVSSASSKPHLMLERPPGLIRVGKCLL